MTSAKTNVGGRMLVWFVVAAGLLLIAGANAHLVYVAASSQPDCVPHARLGDGAQNNTSFSAARSSCAVR